MSDTDFVNDGISCEFAEFTISCQHVITNVIIKEHAINSVFVAAAAAAAAIVVL